MNTFFSYASVFATQPEIALERVQVRDWKELYPVWISLVKQGIRAGRISSSSACYKQLEELEQSREQYSTEDFKEADNIYEKKDNLVTEINKISDRKDEDDQADADFQQVMKKVERLREEEEEQEEEWSEYEQERLRDKKEEEWRDKEKEKWSEFEEERRIELEEEFEERRIKFEKELEERRIKFEEERRIELEEEFEERRIKFEKELEVNLKRARILDNYELIFYGYSYPDEYYD